VNSVPASSAVDKNSSNALSCVILCSLTQFGSLWVSVVCYCQDTCSESCTLGTFPPIASARACFIDFWRSLMRVLPSPDLDFDLGRT
jgi:hypothetical protein